MRGDRSTPTATGGGQLAANVMLFARLLRRAGMVLGTGRVLDAVRALEAVGVARRDDVYWALHAALVSRREQRELFEQAFALFWRPPLEGAQPVLELLAQASRLPRPESKSAPAATRARQAARPTPAAPHRRRRPDSRESADAALSFSAREQLHHKDFEQMTLAELREARRAIARLRLELPPVKTRRHLPDPRGDRIDMRATLRASLRGGGGSIDLRRRRRRSRPPRLVVLCDISGSMARYSRMLLHFVHALMRQRSQVVAFVFGTQLTPITHHLRERDVDAALARVGRAAADWGGGTRIGAALRTFNLRWARRVLGQGGVVLLVSDGLDRDDGRGIAREAARLRRSCRRLLWLNPLLRYAGFEPRALGVVALLPQVDQMLPVHDLRSLTQLVDALGRPGLERPTRFDARVVG